MLYCLKKDWNEEPSYSTTAPVRRDGIAIVIEFNPLERENKVLVAKKTIESAARLLCNTHTGDILLPDSNVIINEWMKNSGRRYHHLTGITVNLNERDWRDFVCNIAFVSQSILIHHGEGELFHHIKKGRGLVIEKSGYDQFLKKTIGCENIPIQNIKNVLDAYRSERDRTLKSPYIEMIMETVFVSLFKPTEVEITKKVEIFPKMSVLSAGTIAIRVNQTKKKPIGTPTLVPAPPPAPRAPPLAPPPAPVRTFADASAQTDVGLNIVVTEASAQTVVGLHIVVPEGEFAAPAADEPSPIPPIEKVQSDGPTEEVTPVVDVTPMEDMTPTAVVPLTSDEAYTRFTMAFAKTNNVQENKKKRNRNDVQPSNRVLRPRSHRVYQ